MALDLDIREVDRAFYAEHVRPFLPERVIDVHTHVWAGRRAPRKDGPKRTVSWPSRVAAENPIEDLLETYRQLLPDCGVTPLIFSSPTLAEPLEALNAPVAEAARAHDVPALALTRPCWPAEQFERTIADGGFLGAKVYLTFAPPYIPADEIRIFDFIPPHQLDVLERHGWVLMLHIPRTGRLGDEVNLAQLVEIDRRWPGLPVIVAHVGRAYCVENVGRAFDVLAETNLRFDISANTNEEVFRGLLDAVGPGRVLFGTDMPILRMRTRRICEDGVYINLVPKGLYGDVSGDPHLRELTGPEAASLTFFLYEEIAAFRRAAEAAGLSAADVRAVFYDNARAILDAAGAAPARPKEGPS
jgi:predicted TIM-barrel fold metal-dependent hydrolase